MNKKTISVHHGYCDLRQHEEPLNPEMALYKEFYRRYIPSGDVMMSDHYFLDERAFEECLRMWSNDTWRYGKTETEANEPVPDEWIMVGIVRHMWSNLPTDKITTVKLAHQVAGQLRFTIEARRCGRIIEGKPVLTGGAEVYICLRPATYCWFSREHKTIRLKPGWTRGDFETAVIKAYQWHHGALARMEAAEALWELVNSISGRAGFSEAVVAREKEVGESKAYSVMSIAEIRQWHAWVRQWAEENPPRA